ncbi:MAG: hypothetical protein WC342_10240 [Methanoregula sp.]|jgi:hypothetical protein
MSRSAFPPYLRIFAVLVFAGILLVLAVTPVAAQVMVTSESFTPPAPLTPGSADTAVVTLSVIPSGATTFPRTHSLQMQTSLVDTEWNIQVYVNGIAAAHQAGTGSAEFINGYLLSYPTTSDVSITVTLSGNIPTGTATDVTILQITEIDTSGGPSPYGSSTVTAPLISSVATVAAPVDTPQKPPVTETTPTRAGSDFGFAAIVLSGLVLAAFGYSRFRQ